MLERAGDGLAHRLELDPVEHVLEEAAHDQALGLGAREAAGHQVEELLALFPPEANARIVEARMTISAVAART